MVYYLTSGNVKILRNIMIEYTASHEVSPYEYMKSYLEKCPENVEDAKLSWITESFLGIQKHGQLMRDITSRLSEELSQEDMDYFMISLYAVTFQIEPKEMQNFYKCLFNLSKPLLNIFTKFLSNNEVLTFISQVAQVSYDATYITDKIINPLFLWQPYIGEMAHTFAEYVKKIENRKIKPLTVPVNPNVLNRKGKERISSTSWPTLPIAPPNSFIRNRKMLTKNTIDQKLKIIHEKNKQKASNLLFDVKNKNFHYAQDKSEKYYKKISSIRDEIENQGTKAPVKPATSGPPVKDTTATVKRLNKRVQLAEEEELEWLQILMTTCRNTTKIEEIEEQDRQERERERLYDIERKHLMGQISYEEAVIAKKKLKDENKKKYEEFLKEKESWNEEIERWRRCELEKNKKRIEKLSLIELNVLNSKNSIATKKKENAEKLKKESAAAIENAIKVKQEELERRINMIKEIKILALIAKKAKVPKIIDLTETSGLGLLCEMSMAELQERLVAFKVGLKDEMDKKKKQIKDEKNLEKQGLEEAKKSIKNYMAQRAVTRKQHKKMNIDLDGSSLQEINDLKKMLEEKRNMRMKMSS